MRETIASYTKYYNKQFFSSNSVGNNGKYLFKLIISKCYIIIAIHNTLRHNTFTSRMHFSRSSKGREKKLNGGERE